MRRSVEHSMITGFPIKRTHFPPPTRGTSYISAISVFLMGIIIVVVMLAVNLIDLPSALAFIALFLILILVIAFIDLRSR